MSYQFPDGARVLHIGPFKTGTTTVQSAFHHSRDAVLAQGVRYAPRVRHPMVAAMAAANGQDLPGRPSGQGARRWERLLSEIHEDDSRATVLSSEFFSEATPERIAAIADGLGRDRIQVVVTLRPLSRILASQWQQYMQNRPALRYPDSMGFEGWLDVILRNPDHTEVTPSFWRRHRHDRVVRAWADVVGADRVTVIAVDDEDQRMLPRTFETLLALEEGTLVPHLDTANRSLTRPEIEALRAFNEEYVARGGSTAEYTRLVRFGAVRYLQERKPAPDEPRLLLPPWAVDKAAEIGAGIAADIRASDVRIIGDLDLLGSPSAAAGVGENAPLTGIPPEIVARFTAGLIRCVSEAADTDESSRSTDPNAAGRVGRADASIVWDGWRRVRRRLGSIRRRLQR